MKHILRLGLLILLLCVSLGAQANEYEAFKAIPVLHEGRVKPLDSVARVYKERLSGNEQDAAAFMAQTIFDPGQASLRPVFYIRDEQVVAQLGVTPRAGHLYSLSEITEGLSLTEDQIPVLLENEATLTESQRTLLRVHENFLIYSRLLGTFSYMLPLAISLPEDLQAEMASADGVSYSDLQPYIDDLEAQLKGIVARKGEDFSQYTEQERIVATLMFRLRTVELGLKRNDLFRIYDGSSWVSPWGLAEANKDSVLFGHLKALSQSYQDGDMTAFNQAARQLSVPEFVSAVKLEVLYKSVKPFWLASVLYGIILLLCVVYCAVPRSFVFLTATGLTVFAAFVQLSGIIARIAILDRPPVGSLYESLLFVSFVIVFLTLLILYFRKQTVTLCGGVAAALGILLVAPYIAPDGDNLETLVAVLNTNFWLATHVICITAGYGVCILAAMLAHVYLFRRGQGDRAEGLWSLLYIMGMVALFFTAFGTMLGGIWADQSWGRFWGWDPKENGALIIVLWIVWLVHGRLGNHLSRLWLAAGFAMLNVIVALAWFGVNLLSVGLHSYGFISGIAFGLSAFCSIEFIIVGLLFIQAQRKRREA